jgi:hypothetical protein
MSSDSESNNDDEPGDEPGDEPEEELFESEDEDEEEDGSAQESEASGDDESDTEDRGSSSRPKHVSDEKAARKERKAERKEKKKRKEKKEKPPKAKKSRYSKKSIFLEEAEVGEGDDSEEEDDLVREEVPMDHELRAIQMEAEARAATRHEANRRFQEASATDVVADIESRYRRQKVGSTQAGYLGSAEGYMAETTRRSLVPGVNDPGELPPSFPLSSRLTLPVATAAHSPSLSFWQVSSWCAPRPAWSRTW